MRNRGEEMMLIRPFSLVRLLVAALALMSLFAATPQAQESSSSAETPFISHGTVFETDVNVTVHARPGDHCVLFWSITPGMTRFHLPAYLGGEVGLGLDPAWLFTSTLDGGINFNSKGTWTFRVPHMDLIRELVDHLYFQVVVFRPGGSGLVARCSNVLELSTHMSATPKSGLRDAVAVPKQSTSTKSVADRPPAYLGKRRGLLGRRRVISNAGTTRLDPFGNIIRQPGDSLR